jgi:hypothetical protein
MEQHPVPQNVTTFQFRLIGDMTLKQFGYLAGGAILAYIFYKLPLPFFLRWPLTVVCGLGGFGFAFVPIEERPMDVWVLSFFRSIYSPTQYVWQKSKPAPEPASVQMQQKVGSAQKPLPPAPPEKHGPPASPQGAALPQKPEKKGSPIARALSKLFQPPTKPKQEPAAKPAMPPPPPRAPTKSTPVVIKPKEPGGPFAWFFKLFAPKPKQAEKPRIDTQKAPVVKKPPTPPVSPFPAVPVPSVTGKHVDTTPPPAVTAPPQTSVATEEARKRAAELEGKLKKLQEELKSKTMTEERILELQRQLTEVLSQKGKLEAELSTIRQRLEARPAPPTRVLTPEKTTPQAQPTVKVITPETAVKAGLPKLTTFPNVITGIIRDFERSLLPGVLVTVRDKDDVPLRALKTNKLGQFAASTPLSNGTYLVEVEDPRGRYVFDRVQVTLNGSVVPALEIVAKNQRQISREKLAKEIFGDKPA